MIGFFRAIGSVVGWLWRTRALRPVFVAALLLWLLDGVVTLATDAQWYASIGMSPLWRAQFAWKVGIETAFVAIGLLASVPLMRAIARPVAGDEEVPPLPRALERWQPLRAKAMRLAWLMLLIAALLLARGLGSHWSEFALAASSSAMPVGSGGIADFWMTRAPALQSTLAALWAWMLVVAAVVLGIGALQALPFLAARKSVAPVRWLRALWWVGAALCLSRGLGFAFEALRHAQIANDSAAARAGFVTLNGLGVLGCVAILALSRRPRPTIALLVAAVLLLPALGGDLLSPFVGHSSLTPPMPTELAVSARTPDDWPQWDEATLLRAARLHLPKRSQNHLVEWQRAGISPQKGQGSRADIVGAPILGDEWAGHGLTDREGELSWQSFELPQPSVVQEASPLGPLFYGLKARPLLSTDIREVGVSFQQWLWKLAWAWRLHDPLLLIEGAQSRRLLVVRGAREVGQKLAPFWTWDDVVPRRDPQTGSAYFECVAYAYSDRLPRTAPFESGVFGGQNVVVPVAVLRLDAYSGAIRLSPFPSSDSLSARWKRAVPALFGAHSPERAPTPALEVARANGTSLVWVGTNDGWQKKAVPTQWRQPLTEKLDQFATTARTRSNSKVHLEGDTPLLWREKGELFLAQAFFDFAAANRSTRLATDGFPSVTGIAVGPLNGGEARWGASFASARAGLGLPEDVAPPLAPGKIPLRDIPREAQEARRRASEALKAGRYVESEKQLQRLDDLLEDLKRQTR